MTNNLLAKADGCAIARMEIGAGGHTRLLARLFAPTERRRTAAS